MTKDNDNNRIIVFDTTLRDGEQASGFHMYPNEKMDIARQLASLGVDVIEAGFPASSQGDFDSVYNISQEVANPGGAKVCALARCVKSDITRAAQALEKANKDYRRIHVFVATSPIHMEKKLAKTPDQVIQMAVNGVSLAKTYVKDVQFSCEDFGRSENDFLVRIIKEAIDAGATTINLPDTVGIMTPSECHQKVGYIVDKFKQMGYNDTIFSVHNHNDLGMATATTIEAVAAGATQVEVTINGIGERSGNAALEEVVAGITLKGLGETGIVTELVGPISRMVSGYTGVAPQPNKAIVGANAFAHESGIHQDGQHKSQDAYEILDPKVWGVESLITLGPRSGRNGLRRHYNEMGIYFGDDEQKERAAQKDDFVQKQHRICYPEEYFQTAAEAFTELADGVKSVDDADLIRALNKGEPVPALYGMNKRPSPTKRPVTYGMEINLRTPDKDIVVDGIGNGLIEAGVSAISKNIPAHYQFQDFSSGSVGESASAMGLSRVHVSTNGWRVLGKAENSDVVTSAISAYLDGCSRMAYIEQHFRNHAS